MYVRDIHSDERTVISRFNHCNPYLIVLSTFIFGVTSLLLADLRLRLSPRPFGFPSSVFCLLSDLCPILIKTIKVNGVVNG